MSKALAVLKLFFSLTSINSTAKSPTSSFTNGTIQSTQATLPMPLLINPVDSIASFVGQAFEYRVPDDTFHPIGQLGLSMLTINKGPISSTSWLRFNSKTSTIYGLPLKGNSGQFKYYIKAINKQGQYADDVINIDIRENGGQYNHEFVLSTDFNFASFVSTVERRFDFIKRLVRYTLQTSDVSRIWIKSYNKELKQITIAFNTMKYSPCDKDKLIQLRNKFVTTSGGIRGDFQRALSNNFPITDVDLRYFGPCDPPTDPPPPPFEWGILKHIMPILMLSFVIGIPVGISCAVRKRSERRRAKLRDQLKKKRREEANGFTFHTVHYNNRYPSMLSVSNTSREDETGDSDNSTSKPVANGSIPSHNMNGPTSVAVNNRPTAHTSQAVNKTPTTPTLPNNEQSAVTMNENKPINVDVKQPTSVNLDKKTNSASRIVYMGKSDMNIPVYYTKPKQNEPESDLSFQAIAETISSTIKGIGKSVMNIAGQGEEESLTNANKAANVSQMPVKDNNVVLLSSELQLPLAVDATTSSQHFSVRNINTEIGKVNVGGRALRHSQSEMKLNDLAHRGHQYNDFAMFDERSNITGTLMNPRTVRPPTRRLSMPHIAGHELLAQEPATPLKSCLKHSYSTMSMSNMNSQMPLQRDGIVIGNLTQQIEQMSREVRHDFGSKGSQNIHYVPVHIDGVGYSYNVNGTTHYGGETIREPAYNGRSALYNEAVPGYTNGQISHSAGQTMYNTGQTTCNAGYSDGQTVYSGGSSTSYSPEQAVHGAGQIINNSGQTLFVAGQTVYSSGQTPCSGGQTMFSGGQAMLSAGQPTYNDVHTVYCTGQTVYSSGQTQYSGGQTMFSGGQTMLSAGQPTFNEVHTVYSAGQSVYNGGQTPYSAGQTMYNDGQISYSADQTVHGAGQTVNSIGQPLFVAGQTMYSGGETPYSAGQTVYSGGQTVNSTGQTLFVAGQTMYSGGETSYSAEQTVYSGAQTSHSAEQILHGAGQAIDSTGQTLIDAGQTIFSSAQTYTAGETLYSGGQMSFNAGQTIHNAGQTVHNVEHTQYSGGQTSFSTGQTVLGVSQTACNSGQTVLNDGQSAFRPAQTAYNDEQTLNVTGQASFGHDGQTSHSARQTSCSAEQTAPNAGKTKQSSAQPSYSGREHVNCGGKTVEAIHTSGAPTYTGGRTVTSTGGQKESAHASGEPTHNQDDNLSVDDEEAMDYTTWRRRKIQKAEQEAQRLQSESKLNQEYHTEITDGNTTMVDYEDFTNPYQYANGSSLTGRSQSTYFPAQDHGFIDDYEKDNRYKQQPLNSHIYSSQATHSMPSLSGGYSHSGYSNSQVNHSGALPTDGKGSMGNLFSQRKPAQNKNVNTKPETQNESLVGFLKTTVGGILGPSEGGSSWFK